MPVHMAYIPSSQNCKSHLEVYEKYVLYVLRVCFSPLEEQDLFRFSAHRELAEGLRRTWNASR